MSRLPTLEAQLVAAAARQQRARRKAPRRIALGLLATAAAAASLLLFAPRRAQETVPSERPVGVPAATLELSRALAAKPAPDTDLRDAIPPAQLPAVAAGLMAQTPYPPGMRDDFDWAATPSNPRSMESINFPKDVEFLVEYRSYCLWLKYWLAGADQAGAAAVIADIPRWPTQRQADGHEAGYQRAIQAAVRDGDVAPVRREVELNCRL
jgi:hypothetical protein